MVEAVSWEGRSCCMEVEQGAVGQEVKLLTKC